MSVSEKARRAVHVLIGELPHKEREDGLTGFLWLVVVFGFFAMWLGEFKDLRGHPLSHGAWRGIVHGGIPLMAIALWELRGKSLAPKILAALGTVSILGIFIAQFFVEGGKAYLRNNAEGVLVPAALGSGLLVLSLVLGGVRLSRWGIAVGDWRFWAPRTAIAIAVLVPVLFAVVWLSPGLADFYPTWKPARKEISDLAILSIGQLLDFVGWEFFFRGFLLFALARRGDVLLAIFFQAVPFFLLHAGKPDVELVMSFFGGIVSGWFCYRAGTFIPLLLLHWVQIVTVGLAADVYRWY